MRPRHARPFPPRAPRRRLRRHRPRLPPRRAAGLCRARFRAAAGRRAGADRPQRQRQVEPAAADGRADGRPEAGTLAWDGAALAEDPAAHRARLHFIGHQRRVEAGAHRRARRSAFWAGMRGGGDVAAALARFRLAALARLAVPLCCRPGSAGGWRWRGWWRARRRCGCSTSRPTGLDADAVADLLAAIAAHRAARRAGRALDPCRRCRSTTRRTCRSANSGRACASRPA